MGHVVGLQTEWKEDGARDWSCRWLCDVDKRVHMLGMLGDIGTEISLWHM